jgi:predicted enzyme related to lactoylglutathione lyase
MNRVTHFDLVAKKPEAIVDFYQRVFGWKFSKWDGPMEYWMIKTGTGSNGINGGLSSKKIGGMMGGADMTIEVKSIDNTLMKIMSEGGKVTMQKMAIPKVGWFASFKDPEGNIFGVMQNDKKAKFAVQETD